jgi:hypothetical protein
MVTITSSCCYYAVRNLRAISVRNMVLMVVLYCIYIQKSKVGFVIPTMPSAWQAIGGIYA